MWQITCILYIVLESNVTSAVDFFCKKENDRWCCCATGSVTAGNIVQTDNPIAKDGKKSPKSPKSQCELMYCGR